MASFGDILGKELPLPKPVFKGGRSQNNPPKDDVVVTY